MNSSDKIEYYLGTTAPKRSSEACVDALWRLALKDCAKEYHLAVRRMAEQILEDLKRYEILKNKFDIYILDDDEGNIYYCMELNSNNCFIEITKKEYDLLSKIENRQMNIYDYRQVIANDN